MIDERPGLFAPGVLATLQATFPPLSMSALDELVRLSREATPGDWLLVTDSADSGKNWTIFFAGDDAGPAEITSDHLHMDEVAPGVDDARFIVALRNAAPALLTEITEGRALRQRIREEISEKLDYEPAKVKVLQTVRPKYTCRDCDAAG